MDDYLSKPIDFDKLVNIMKKYLQNNDDNPNYIEKNIIQKKNFDKNIIKERLF
jgi:DNA-binding response OmpR family regulator